MYDRDVITSSLFLRIHSYYRSLTFYKFSTEFTNQLVIKIVQTRTLLVEIASFQFHRASYRVILIIHRRTMNLLLSEQIVYQ